MKLTRTILVLLAASVLASSPLAAAPEDPKAALAALPETGSGQVASVPDGMDLTLEDGRTVHLAGILVPPPLGKGDDTGPLSSSAQSTLAAIAAGQSITLRGPVEKDRYGRLVAQVMRTDGLWPQGVLLSAGLARVATTPDHRELAAPMLRLEARAREHKLGLWRTRQFAVKSPGDLRNADSSFELVEGKIASVDDKRGTIWLDFGNGQAAAVIAHPARALFADAGVNLPGLAGQTIRVRGWVRWAGRPVIDVTHPEQIEQLGQPGE